MERNSLRHVVDAVEEAVNKFGEGKIFRIPASERLYQFKITLKGIRRPIWRRILVKDCSLDKLHEHIQTAMGWTNSHLHQFTIGGVLHGDPEHEEHESFMRWRGPFDPEKFDAGMATKRM